MDRSVVALPAASAQTEYSGKLEELVFHSELVISRLRRKYHNLNTTLLSLMFSDITDVPDRRNLQGGWMYTQTHAHTYN